MNKSIKTWLIIASVLIGFGLIIFAGVMFAYDWDFSKLRTVTYETNIYRVSGDFDSISIDADTAEITFAPTDEKSCRIVCYEMAKVKHSATVQNGLLTINTVNTGKWYDQIGIFWGSPKMTVYLPNDKYTDVFIETDTGDVLIPKDFSFGTLKIEGDTADVDCLASVSEEVQIETDTGDIKIDGITANRAKLSTDTGNITLLSAAVKNNLEIQTDTGKMNIADVHCRDLQATSNTGNIRLKKVVALGRFSIETDTGDVYFNSSDAQEIFIQTNTGDVKGSLLTDKVFITETDTGRVDVPKTTTGGKCEISTDTGDIIIERE